MASTDSTVVLTPKGEKLSLLQKFFYHATRKLDSQKCALAYPAYDKGS